MTSVPTLRPVPVPQPEAPPPSAGGVDLHTIAGELVRDLIRRDPALWACVQADASLLRQFGFDSPDGAGPRDGTGPAMKRESPALAAAPPR